MVKYSGNITGCNVMFSYEVVWFMNDVAFVPVLSIFCTWYSMMILHGFNIICDMFCVPIKDAFLKDVKNTWERMLFLVKM